MLNKLFEVFSPFKTYFRNLLVVFAGSASSELIPILAAPLLTRIYSPEDFGQYGFVLSIAILLGQFSTLRYENSIVISKTSHEIYTALKTCEYITVIINLLFLFLSLFINICIFGFSLNKIFYVWCLLIPLSSFSGAFFRIQILLANREERFKFVANIRIMQAFLIAILSIVFGLGAFTANGLILALIVGNLGGAFSLRSSKKTTSCVTKTDLFVFLKRYKNFPIYSLPAELINNGANRYPLIAFPFLMGDEVGGYLTLAYRIVGMPSRLVSNAVGEIFFQSARKEIGSNKECRHIFLLTTIILIITGVLGFGVLFLSSDYIFGMVFGKMWKATGVYIKVLIPLFLVSFIVSPLSTMIYISEKQSWDLIWQVTYFMMVLGSSLGSWFLFGNIELTLLSFVIAASLTYAVYFTMLFTLAKGSAHEESGPTHEKQC